MSGRAVKNALTTEPVVLNQGLKQAGRMWPVKACYAARDAFREFSYNQHLSYLIYSPVFKSAQPVSEQVPFKTT